MIMANYILSIPRTGHSPESALRGYPLPISDLLKLAYLSSIRLSIYILLIQLPVHQP
jgi:hypothetical protein